MVMARFFAPVLLLLLPCGVTSLRSPTGHARPATRVRSCGVSMLSDGESLAKEFAAEAQRRRQQAEGNGAAADNEPFRGIREIVLDETGAPQAIPRRAPPPPSTSMTDTLSELTARPEYVIGVVASIGVLVLLVAIGDADGQASVGYGYGY